MARNVFYALGQIAGRQVRKAKWIWHSAAGSEADAIQAERSAGRDMAAVVLEETPCDPDPTAQALLDEVLGKLARVVRNRLHHFQVTCLKRDRPAAFALPGGFLFVARPLIDLCGRNPDEIAFIVAHEMSHVIRRHAIDRLLEQKVLSTVTLVSPGRGAFAGWLRRVGFQALERAHLQDEEFEADELGLMLMRAAGFNPAGAIRTLQRFRELDRGPDRRGLGAYLSTHPTSDDRVVRLRRVANNFTPRS